jgi:hypothetical protein
MKHGNTSYKALMEKAIKSAAEGPQGLWSAFCTVTYAIELTPVLAPTRWTARRVQEARVRAPEHALNDADARLVSPQPGGVHRMMKREGDIDGYIKR